MYIYIIPVLDAPWEEKYKKVFPIVILQKFCNNIYCFAIKKKCICILILNSREKLNYGTNASKKDNVYSECIVKKQGMRI